MSLSYAHFRELFRTSSRLRTLPLRWLACGQLCKFGNDNSQRRIHLRRRIHSAWRYIIIYIRYLTMQFLLKYLLSITVGWYQKLPCDFQISLLTSDRTRMALPCPLNHFSLFLNSLCLQMDSFYWKYEQQHRQLCPRLQPWCFKSSLATKSHHYPTQCLPRPSTREVTQRPTYSTLTLRYRYLKDTIQT